jgi:hypothetical protein
MFMLIILLKVIGVILLADFISGVFHWLEDSFWSPETFILGKWIVVANLAHHKNGQDFIQKNYLESSWDLLLLGITIVSIAYSLNCLTWEITLFAVIIANANQIHKWAHITRPQNKPYLINLLQKCYVLQRTQHHGQHHRSPNNSHYCIITNALNPILDKTHFWRGLEAIFGSKASL